MPKLPQVSAKKVINALEKVGYQVVRQKGSHIRLHHKTEKDRRPLTVPNHKIISKGLLRKLLRDADLTVADFLKLL